MFSLTQIQAAHSKVKSGADFPAYVLEIKNLGVKSYDYFVTNGATQYFGENDFKISSDSKYPEIEINSNVNKDQFLVDLKAHQNGKTDFITFVNDCAKSGINKWKLDIINGVCLYFDKKNQIVLEETIPA